MTMRKRYMMVAFGVVAVAVYTGVWLMWRNGSRLETSEWAHLLQKSKIIVRKLPSSAPFWAVPLSIFPDDNPRYRCEYYRFGSSILFSAHTFQGESFTAQTARIKWDDTGAATVYFDNDPVLKCDPQGYWSINTH